MKFSATHAKDAKFDAGLREFFEYRDLGIAAATSGKVGANLIRANGKHPADAPAHRHGLQFQMFYVLKGWVKFNYEGIGDVLCELGTCVHQPPGIRHTEVAHSDDLELIEITMPAEFTTEKA